MVAGASDPVAAMRKVMAQPDKAVQAYIVPSEDPHMVSNDSISLGQHTNLIIHLAAIWSVLFHSFSLLANGIMGQWEYPAVNLFRQHEALSGDGSCTHETAPEPLLALQSAQLLLFTSDMLQGTMRLNPSNALRRSWGCTRHDIVCPCKYDVPHCYIVRKCFSHAATGGHTLGPPEQTLIRGVSLKDEYPAYSLRITYYPCT